MTATTAELGVRYFGSQFSFDASAAPFDSRREDASSSLDRARLQTQLRQAQAARRVRELVTELKREGRRLGIVTAKRRKTVELAFAVLPLERGFKAPGIHVLGEHDLVAMWAPGRRPIVPASAGASDPGRRPGPQDLDRAPRVLHRQGDRVGAWRGVSVPRKLLA